MLWLFQILNPSYRRSDLLGSLPLHKLSRCVGAARCNYTRAVVSTCYHRPKLFDTTTEMAASAVALSSRCFAAPRPVVARKTQTFRPVRASRAVVVRASAEQQKLALPAGVTAGMVAMLSSPLVAEAAVTPSLRNFFYSLVAGGTVLAIIAIAITAVAGFDPVRRS